jgi:hypothetical protein
MSNLPEKFMGTGPDGKPQEFTLQTLDLSKEIEEMNAKLDRATARVFCGDMETHEDMLSAYECGYGWVEGVARSAIALLKQIGFCPNCGPITSNIGWKPYCPECLTMLKRE